MHSAIYWRFNYQNLIPGKIASTTVDYIFSQRGYEFYSKFNIYQGPWSTRNDELKDAGQYYVDYPQPPDGNTTFRASVPATQYTNNDLLNGWAQTRGNTWRTSITTPDVDAYIINLDTPVTLIGNGTYTASDGTVHTYDKYETGTNTHYLQWMNETSVVQLASGEIAPDPDWLIYIPEEHKKAINADGIIVTDRNRLITDYQCDEFGNPV